MKARLIVVQFSFSNPKFVPPLVGAIVPETREESSERRERATGELVIEPTERIGIQEFPYELEREGYQMVDGFTQRRVGRPGSGKPVYYTVRFVFAKREAATPSEAFLNKRDGLRGEFRFLCRDSFWRVRAFRNPFFENDAPVDGEFTIALNFEVRVPRFAPDGSLLKEWEKDAEGNKLGDAAHVLEPKGYLRVQNGSVVLLG